jgi:hypothetical protein
MEIVDSFLSAYLELGDLTTSIIIDLNSTWQDQLGVTIDMSDNSQTERRWKFLF